jgi:preprotein translocase subunit SecA
VAGLEKVLRDEWQIEIPLRQELETATAITDDDVVEKVLAAANAAFAEKLEKIGEENFTQFERVVLLQSIDSHWREHLSALDYLRQGIHLRGYAQKQHKQ